MSRLLHAAARGARIEDDGVGAWSESRFVHLVGSDWEYRIHPDDAHLQYGLISGALREYAETAHWPYTLSALMAKEAYEYELPLGLTEFDAEQIQMFLLILAEDFADRGW